MRDTFILHTAYAEKFKRLSDAQFGFLIRSLMDYQKHGIIPDFTDDSVAFAFEIAKVELDISNQKYEEVCEKRRIAGSIGGQAKQANATKCKQMVAKGSKSSKTYHNDNDNDNDNDFKNIISVQKPRTVFIPPSVDEVRAYCTERNNNVNAETFVDFYTSKGWMIGKDKMKDWKAAVRTWEKKDKDVPKIATLSKPNQFQQFEQRDRSQADFTELERKKLRGF